MVKRHGSSPIESRGVELDDEESDDVYWTVEPTLETAVTVGQRIRALYRAKGYNRHSLATKLGNAYTTIIAWERDKNAPRGKNLQNLSVALGVSSSVILGEERPMTEAQYETWGAFLETALGRSMSRTERVALGSMRFDPEDVISVERYGALLIALRGSAQKLEVRT